VSFATGSGPGEGCLLLANDLGHLQAPGDSPWAAPRGSLTLEQWRASICDADQA
jgi:hypothetical protein